MNKTTVLLVVVLLALGLRVYRLDRIPNGFFFDEATISYQAYTLSQTQRDTWDTKWPLLSFKDYGEYILPVGVYGQIPSLVLGGLDVFAARLPHALLGTAAVILVFYLGRLLAGDFAGLAASVLLAVSPLSLGWSRFVFEGNFGTVFFLAGVVFLTNFLKRPSSLPWAVAAFGLSMLTYHVFLVAAPAYLGLFYLFNRRGLPAVSGQTFVPAIILGLFFLLWAAGAVYSGSGRQRFSQAATLLSAQELDVLNHNLVYCQRSLPKAACKLFFNKPVFWALSYGQNYVGHFSPDYLGFDGSFLRSNILPKSGLVLWGELPAFFLGLIGLLKNRRVAAVLLPWVLVYPLANSFTGTGEISRVAFAAPLLSILSAYGLRVLWQLDRKLAGAVLVLIFISALEFLVNYFVIFPVTNAYYSDFGYDRVFAYVRNRRANYERILISRNYAGSVPYISALFFLPVPPADFGRPGVVLRRRDEKGYFLIDKIENLYFYQDLSGFSPTARDLIVAAPQDLTGRQYDQFVTIADPTGRKLLQIVQLKSANSGPGGL